MGKSRPIEERFFEKITKTDKCWIWNATKNIYGYGIIQLAGRHGKRQMAHRISYEIHYGEVDKKFFVCHKCDNPCCVNPEHLFLGTQKDNMNDCSIKGRTNKQKISKDFIFKSPNGDIVSGKNLTEFCKQNNLNQGAMWSVLNGKIKSHKGYKSFNY